MRLTNCCIRALKTGEFLRWGRGAMACSPNLSLVPIFGYNSSKTSKQLYMGRFWKVGVVYLVVLASVACLSLRETAKKVVNIFPCPHIFIEPPLLRSEVKINTFPEF